MTARIEYINENVSSPIFFPELLSPEKVNAVLNPSHVTPKKNDAKLTNYDLYTEMKEDGRDETIDCYFQPAENVIIRTENGGIYTLSPRAALRRKMIMDGKTQLLKIFCDCLGMFSTGTLTDNKIFVPYGFTRDQLIEIKERTDNGETLDLREIEKFDVGITDIVTTNMFFSVPLDKLDEILSLERQYSTMMMNAIRFLIQNQNRIADSIYARDFENFPGVKGSVDIISYFKTNFCACFLTDKRSERKNVFEIIADGPALWWPEEARDLFNVNLEKSKNRRVKKGDRSKNQFLMDNGIIAFACNSGTNLYTLLRLPEKVAAYEAAKRRSAMKADEEDD